MDDSIQQLVPSRHESVRWKKKDTLIVSLTLSLADAALSALCGYLQLVLFPDPCQELSSDLLRNCLCA